MFSHFYRVGGQFIDRGHVNNECTLFLYTGKNVNFGNSTYFNVFFYNKAKLFILGHVMFLSIDPPVPREASEAAAEPAAETKKAMVFLFIYQVL